MYTHLWETIVLVTALVKAHSTHAGAYFAIEPDTYAHRLILSPSSERLATITCKVRDSG